MDGWINDSISVTSIRGNGVGNKGPKFDKYVYLLPLI